MAIPPATPGYPTPIKLLHWLTAIIVIGLVPLGLSLGSLPRGAIQNAGYDLHRSFGALVLALTAIRLATRITLGVPRPELSLPDWQIKASTVAHWVLYLLLFVVPLLGWAATSAYGATIHVFGLFVLPPILEKNRELSEILFEAHGVAAMAMAAVFFIHAGAALHHRFVRRDGVLARMTWG